MRFFNLLIVGLVGSLLLWGTMDFPRWADPNAPASRHVSPYYLEHAIDDMEVPNVVSAILADYRGYDTMYETVVIFCAGISILLLLRVGETAYMKKRSLKIRLVRRNPILIIACRILFPAIVLFALYVIAHGHHSPGGGFQGGVILGAGFILIALAYNMHIAIVIFYPRLHRFIAALGVTIYSLVGLICLLLGGNFLDYSALSKILPVSPAEARSLGILAVEIGVGFTVMAIMFSIYADLSTRGRLRRGL
ncbi:MAG: Na(+)/H(+) antiporter subunit B [Candidatus Dadabacteria bacterium]|nr:MAG: Na(+)/H(+) antiporter subunit B [Candidatus Dadabacteria bacterium]